MIVSRRCVWIDSCVKNNKFIIRRLPMNCLKYLKATPTRKVSTKATSMCHSTIRTPS